MTEADKRTSTAERYKKRRSFSMAGSLSSGNVQGASVGGGGLDTAAILEAIDELRQEVADFKRGGAVSTAKPDPEVHEIDEEEEADVRIEIAQMVRSIGRTKSELAAIKHPMADDDRIKAASSELDEIVVATQSATEDILHST